MSIPYVDSCGFEDATRNWWDWKDLDSIVAAEAAHSGNYGVIMQRSSGGSGGGLMTKWFPPYTYNIAPKTADVGSSHGIIGYWTKFRQISYDPLHPETYSPVLGFHSSDLWGGRGDWAIMMGPENKTGPEDLKIQIVDGINYIWFDLGPISVGDWHKIVVENTLTPDHCVVTVWIDDIIKLNNQTVTFVTPFSREIYFWQFYVDNNTWKVGELGPYVDDVFYELTPPTPTNTFQIYSNGQGSTDPPTGLYTYRRGSTTWVTATPADGWAFQGWQVNGVDAGSINPMGVTINVDTVVIATFVPVEVEPAGFPWWLLLLLALGAWALSEKDKKRAQHRASVKK